MVKKSQGYIAASQLSEDQADAIYNSLEDPRSFGLVYFDDDIWEIQEEILKAVLEHKKVSIRSCHSSGKTHTMALLTLWWLLKYDNAIVITTAPTANQVESILWPEIHLMLSKARIALPKANQTKLVLGEKRFAMGFVTSTNTDDAGAKAQGFHADHLLFIVDEAAGVDPAMWEAMEGAAAGGDTRIVAIGNPTITSGTFFETFTSKSETWHNIKISAFDTPNLKGLDINKLLEMRKNKDPELDHNIKPYLTTRRWVLDAYLEYGEDSDFYQSRVLGNFPSQSDSSLINIDDIERSSNELDSSDNKFYAGIDVAGPGEDETVLYVRKGPNVVFSKAYPDEDPRGKVLADLMPFMSNLANVNVDSAGIGYNFGLHLKDHGVPVTLVNVGTSPNDPSKYANLKAELYWALRLRFEAGAVGGLTDKLTRSQLGGIRYSLTPRGTVKIESKADAAKRGVSSPDRAEALMLCFSDNSATFLLLDVVRKKRMERTALKNISKVDTPQNAMTCECGSKGVVKFRDQYRCSQCGKQWSENKDKRNDLGSFSRNALRKVASSSMGAFGSHF